MAVCLLLQALDILGDPQGYVLRYIHSSLMLREDSLDQDSNDDVEQLTADRCRSQKDHKAKIGTSEAENHGNHHFN